MVAIVNLAVKKYKQGNHQIILKIQESTPGLKTMGF